MLFSKRSNSLLSESLKLSQVKRSGVVETGKTNVDQLLGKEEDGVVMADVEEDGLLKLNKLPCNQVLKFSKFMLFQSRLFSKFHNK